MSQPILTIAIPTYNRAGLLDQCLSQLGPQVRRHADRVELLVSDNASTDATDETVARHQAAGLPLRYVRNEANIGPDLNFVQCLELASGAHFLLLGDDDLVLDGALDKLLPILERERPGVAHLGSFPFKQDFRSKVHRRLPSGKVLRFTDKAEFAAKVNIMFTFISANVINKACLGPGFSPAECLNTNLVQLSWTFEAMLNGEVNVLVDDFLIAAKDDNSGGYEFCRVFGVNLNRIFDRLVAKGADPRVFEAINRKTITTFFPDWILRLRQRQGNFGKENPAEVLRPVFRRFPAFWLMVLPVSTWPVLLAKPWFKLCRKWLKITGRW